MQSYFATHCSSYVTASTADTPTLSQAPSSGVCSVADVIDRVAVPLLDDILSTLRTVAYGGLVAAVIFIYVAIVTLIALNVSWEVCPRSSSPFLTLLFPSFITIHSNTALDVWIPNPLISSKIVLRIFSPTLILSNYTTQYYLSAIYYLLKRCKIFSSLC